MKKPSLTAEKKRGRPKGSTAKPKEAKAPKAAKGSVKGDNLPDRDLQALFFEHREKIADAEASHRALKDRVKKSAAAVKSAYAAAAQAGISRVQFDIAKELDTPEGEERVRIALVGTGMVSRWMGSAIGTQFEFDALLEPDRTPAVDRAAQEGRRDCLENKAAKPSYAPETEQYRAYMTAFHDASAELVGKGMKKPAEKPARPEKAAKPAKDANGSGDAPAAPKAGKDTISPDQVTSGVPVTRAAFRAALQKNEQDANAMFKKREAGKPDAA